MPNNFSWLEAGKLAGMGCPGGREVGDLDAELDWLCDRGVRAIVSLTEVSLPEALLRQRDMAYLHLPVRDMDAPTIEDFLAFSRFVDRAAKESRPVAVHCQAGMGRTGTMLAAYLVDQGRNALEALAQVREQRPGSVETYEQEAAVFAYASYRQHQVRKPDEGSFS